MGRRIALYRILYRLDVKVLVELKFVWMRLVAVYCMSMATPILVPYKVENF
jgi:hypothetical protein